MNPHAPLSQRPPGQARDRTGAFVPDWTGGAGPSRFSDGRRMLSQFEACTLFFFEGLFSSCEVARLLGVDGQTVSRWITRHLTADTP